MQTYERIPTHMPNPRAEGEIHNGDVKLAYEIHGAGPALVLISGFGADRHMWFAQVRDLAEHFTLILFDARGTGLSDTPNAPYSTRLFSEDIVALLDALGIEKAYIAGASMGGFVAQDLALDFAERVLGLALLCTHVGGQAHIPADPETIRQMLLPMEDPGEKLRAAYAMFTGLTWFNAHGPLLDWLADVRRSRPTSKTGYRHQLSLAANFSSHPRLAQLKIPTLILHGEADVVVPVENAHLLKASIAHAQLQTYAQLGHAFFVEAPDRVNRALVDFFLGEAS